MPINLRKPLHGHLLVAAMPLLRDEDDDNDPHSVIVAVVDRHTLNDRYAVVLTRRLSDPEWLCAVGYEQGPRAALRLAADAAGITARTLAESR